MLLETTKWYYDFGHNHTTSWRTFLTCVGCEWRHSDLLSVVERTRRIFVNLFRDFLLFVLLLLSASWFQRFVFYYVCLLTYFNRPSKTICLHYIMLTTTTYANYINFLYKQLKQTYATWISHKLMLAYIRTWLCFLEQKLCLKWSLLGSFQHVASVNITFSYNWHLKF